MLGDGCSGLRINEKLASVPVAVAEVGRRDGGALSEEDGVALGDAGFAVGAWSG